VATGVTAIGGRDRQGVVVIHVAGSTGNIGVPVGQQKSRGAVIKRCGVPTDRGVAIHAVGRSESWT
jgi:hypothetical protein